MLTCTQYGFSFRNFHIFCTNYTFRDSSARRTINVRLKVPTVLRSTRQEVSCTSSINCALGCRDCPTSPLDQWPPKLTLLLPPVPVNTLVVVTKLFSRPSHSGLLICSRWPSPEVAQVYPVLGCRCIVQMYARVSQRGNSV